MAVQLGEFGTLPLVTVTAPRVVISPEQLAPPVDAVAHGARWPWQSNPTVSPCHKTVAPIATEGVDTAVVMSGCSWLTVTGSAAQPLMAEVLFGVARVGGDEVIRLRRTGCGPVGRGGNGCHS